MRSCLAATILMMAISPLVHRAALGDTRLSESLSSLQQIGREGQGHTAARQAWQVVAAASAEQLPQILAAMPEGNPLADNWIRAAVDAIASRTLSDGGKLPTDALELFIAEKTHSPRSRRLAFEWLTRVDPTARDRWIPQLFDDPSLELRRESVASKLEQAVDAEAAGDTQLAVACYQKALTHARDIDQIESAYDALKKLGQPINLPQHFGFVMNWHLIGPFDNTDKNGFDQAYAPEVSIDLKGEYSGKDDIVRWQESTTEDDYGKVDLNDQIGKHMGAAAYAVAFFESDVARPVELRLGCINANKVWLNGELLTANHVYHSGSSIDQYVGKGALRPGQNVILLKICQNEQTESWAQDWAFQLRVCDQLGTAVAPSAVTP